MMYKHMCSIILLYNFNLYTEKCNITIFLIIFVYVLDIEFMGKSWPSLRFVFHLQLLL